MNPAIHTRITSYADAERAIRSIRDTVFGLEQRVAREIDWDGKDPSCLHVVATDGDGRAIGTGRLQPDGKIGRLAVLKPWRGQGIGARMLAELVECARGRGLRSVYLHAQEHAVVFYEKGGFEREGEEFLEAGIRHVAMIRHLEARDKETSTG